MNQNCGQKIGATLIVVEEVDVDADDGVGWGNSLRVKVQMGFTKSIARGRKITIKGHLHWIIVKYEKLGRVCFLCGCVIHLSKQCPNATSHNGSKDWFGLFGICLAL